MARAKKLPESEEMVMDEVKVEEVLVEDVQKPKKTAKKVTKKGKVFNCSFLNVRETASLDSNIVRCIPAGSEIEILGNENNFYKIVDGFVLGSFIEL